MKPNKFKSALPLAVIFLASLAVNSNAASIAFLGSDGTTAANWRTTTTIKSSTFDPNGDNAYGTDGYYFGSGPNTGNTTTPTVLLSSPSYVSSITTSGLFYSTAPYTNFDNPTLPIGSSVADVKGGLYYNNGTKFSFTVGSATEFILTVMWGGNALAPDNNTTPSSISVVQTAGSGSGTATSSSLPVLNTGEYAFFRVNAAAGDSFNINIAATSLQGLTGIAFETVPEPSAALLGGLGMLALLRRRRN